MLRRCVFLDKEKWITLNLEFMAYEYEDENIWEDPLKKGKSSVQMILCPPAFNTLA